MGNLKLANVCACVCVCVCVCVCCGFDHTCMPLSLLFSCEWCWGSRVFRVPRAPLPRAFASGPGDARVVSWLVQNPAQRRSCSGRTTLKNVAALSGAPLLHLLCRQLLAARWLLHCFYCRRARCPCCWCSLDSPRPRRFESMLTLTLMLVLMLALTPTMLARRRRGTVYRQPGV